MYTNQIITKVPGKIPAESQKERQGYIGDLTQKTVPQLNELLDRQKKILANKTFLRNLADKGDKIMKLKEEIEEELKKRNESENLTRMLSALSMNGKEDLDALEWTGQCVPGHVAQQDEKSLSDDETDPFKILASHSGAGFHKKKHKVIKPEEPLIKPSDLVVEKEDRIGEPEEEIEEYAKHLCEKLQSMKPKVESKFFPFKTLKCTVKEKKVGKTQGRWEVTAATPPPPIHGDTKLVSLQESFRLQSEQQHKLKEIQMRHAAERLAVWQDQGPSSSHPLIVTTAGSYREPDKSSSEDELSEHEVHDEEYPDRGGITVYNLVDDVTTDQAEPL